MRIAIIGARVAGSYAAQLLARMGQEVLLIDDSTLREKPCGGGVTAKALRTISWFHENPLPHTEINVVRLTAHDGHSSDLQLRRPIRVFSRCTLDSALRDSAIAAGARFVPAHASGFLPTPNGWVVKTSGGEIEADFLVGADGAGSRVRRATSGRLSPGDQSLALGFYLPGEHHRNTIVTVFQESGFTGYLWSFPRTDHVSVGILRWLPQANAADLRARVLDFIAERYPHAGQEKRFYAARIPCLSRSTIARQRVCGSRWALLGDAAGFADAVTAEGISFALRSAELFAQAIRRGHPLYYEYGWRHDFGSDLLRAALWRDRFYGGTFLLQAFTRRTLQALRYSSTIRELTDDYVGGLRSYEALRRGVILRSPRILLEALRGILSARANA